MRFYGICALLLLALSFGCAPKGVDSGVPAGPAPLDSGALLLPGGEKADDLTFESMVKKADYILIGETHDVFGDHLAQALILERMVQAGLAPVIGLEMIPATMQPVLDKFNRGGLTVDELPAALDWPRTWGFVFDLYRPVFETAYRYKLPLYGLNLPYSLVREARLKGMDGIANAEAKKLLPKRVILPLEVQKAELEKFYKAHERFFNMEEKTKVKRGKKASEQVKAGRFILAQSLWDSAMAEHAVDTRRLTSRPVVILTGIGHVEYDWGIGHRLSALDMTSSRLLILPWRYDPAKREDTAQVTDPEIPPASMADLYYYSPLVRQSRLGIELSDLSDHPGLYVESVTPGSPAEQAGLKAEDVIVKAGGKEVTRTSDLHAAAIEAWRQGQNLPLTVERAGENKELSLALPHKTTK